MSSASFEVVVSDALVSDSSWGVPSATAGGGARMREAGGDLGAAANGVRRDIAARLFGAPAPVRVVGGRYVLVERLGAGGQGTVWRAHDRQLGRDVAIKVVHLLGARSPEHEWLRREARALGRVAHPGIVAVFDLGLASATDFDASVDDHLAMYVVMELVDGPTLAGWLDAAPRSPTEILARMREVAEALAVVHAAGLVHCDVKPSNILVDEGAAKLADFGLAHAHRALVVKRPGTLIDHDAGWESTLAPDGGRTSASGPIGGTVRYMAPEQITGARIDARADEFALAATIFEALYRCPPHGGQTVGEYLEAKRAGPPSQPTRVLSRAAYRVLCRGLAAEPAQRHGGPLQLVAALERALRVRGATIFAAGALVASLGVMGVGLDRPCAPVMTRDADADVAAVVAAARASDAGHTLADRAGRRLRDHYVALGDARSAACVADAPAVQTCLARIEAATSGIVDVLRDADERQARRMLVVLDRLPDPAQCTAPDAEPSQVGPPIEGGDDRRLAQWAEVSAARALDDAGDTPAALARLTAVEVEHEGPLAHEVGIVRGNLLLGSGRYDAAVAAFEQTFAAAEASGDGQAAARAAVGLAFVTGTRLHRLDDGLEWVRHGETNAARAAVRSGVELDLANARGTVLFAGGRHVEARAVFDDALRLAAAADLPPARTRALRENAAMMASLAGDRAGVDALAEVQAELADVLGEDHPSAIRALANVGTALLRFGELDRGRQALERALALRQGALASETVEDARILSQLASVDREQGDVAAALVRLAAANDLRARWLPATHPERADGVLQQIEVMQSIGDLDGAQRLLDLHRDTWSAEFDADNPMSIDIAETRGRLAAARGDHELAAAELSWALERSIAIGRDDSDLEALALATDRAVADAAAARGSTSREGPPAADPVRPRAP